MTRLLSIAVLAATLGSSAVLADGSARALLPMGGDVGYGSTETREPLVTGSIGRRNTSPTGLWSAGDDVGATEARPHRRVGAPGRLGF